MDYCSSPGGASLQPVIQQWLQSGRFQCQTPPLGVKILVVAVSMRIRGWRGSIPEVRSAICPMDGHQAKYIKITGIPQGKDMHLPPKTGTL